MNVNVAWVIIQGLAVIIVRVIVFACSASFVSSSSKLAVMRVRLGTDSAVKRRLHPMRQVGPCAGIGGQQCLWK